MRREHPWPALPTGWLGELGTTQAAGQLSAVLFGVCGLLVAVTSPLMPSGPGVRHLALVVVGLVAAAAGAVMAVLPWRRWPRPATLVLVPVAFLLIAAHNWASGANGLRYSFFFLVVAAWVGLMHPSGTTLVLSPFMVAAYLLPTLWVGDLADVATSLTYAVPVFVLVGECASLVAERVRSSEAQLRSSEQRFAALVRNATDAISVIAGDGTILWESPGVTAVLGYAPDERIGANGLNYLTMESAAEVAEVLAEVVADPGASRRIELQIPHKDGGLRWCEVTGRNLLHEPAVGGLVVNISDVTERHRAQSLQRELVAIVESSTDAIISHSLDGQILSANTAAAQMYGWPHEVFVTLNMRDLALPDDAGDAGDGDGVGDGDVSGHYARLGAGESFERILTRHRRSDGSELVVSMSVSPVRDSAGTVTSAAAIVRDITDEVRARDALADTAASFRLLFFANPQPMWVYDAETLQFLEVNDAAINHYGYSREQFLAMTILDIRPDDEVARLLDNLRPDRGDLETDGWHHRLADGRVIDVDVTAHRLSFNGRDAVLVAALDTTERNALESQLRHQAFHDSLTGLSNRALFQDRLEHALDRREKGAGPVVLLLDLDQFKVINDSQGHATGDELLVAVARRLASTVRGGDTVARLGGDEFAVLLERSAPQLAERQAARLLASLSAPMQIGGTQVVATASIGIAAAEPGMTAGEVLRNADMAMYRAKSAGGSCSRVFEADMHADAVRQMDLMASLRDAVENEHFVLHYQPVIDVQTRQVAAMEALIRWRHNGMLVPPAEFIPALEESGLIVEVGEWVLRRACLDAASWCNPEVQVNVNLSGRQVAAPDIVRHVRQALDESGLPPHQLVLEITESVLMHNSEASAHRLRQLRGLGVSIAIDDFGTGYSSLSYLRTFPLDELKIDKSFIDAIAEDPASMPLVATIVQLARSLSLATVAEGVETQAQLELVTELGCDRVQGFYFAAPKPLDEALRIPAPRAVAPSESRVS